MNETSNHSHWSSRLLCPPEIHLEGKRTGAVLTKRMNTYEDGVFTKVVSNHVNRRSNQSNWSSILPCPQGDFKQESKFQGDVSQIQYLCLACHMLSQDKLSQIFQFLLCNGLLFEANLPHFVCTLTQNNTRHLSLL